MFEQLTLLACRHLFHTACIRASLDNRAACPVCAMAVIDLTGSDTDHDNNDSDGGNNNGNNRRYVTRSIATRQRLMP